MYTKAIDEVKRILKTNINMGLSDEDVRTRKEEFGRNKIENSKKDGLLKKFFKQFNDFMIIILIGASILSAVISYFEGSNDYLDSIIIIFIVIFNAIMGVVQESKAEKSIEALKEMTAPTSKVKRNGKIEIVSSEEIVPGDIVILEAGNFVPADCRLVNAMNLKIEESTLTGETIPVEKRADIILEKDINIGDMVNMAFSGTTIVNGHGEGIVVATGMDTKVGKIAKMIIEEESPETPIQKKLSEVGKILGIGCLIICVLIFAIGITKRIEPMEMFMTSVGLAVAAIPEGLPAIVTIMLSIGVTKMSKKNAIIRKLPAVETLGSSKVICSDKTGTLTQNKMQVVKIVGDEELTLKYGTMCSDAYLENGKCEGEPTEVAIVDYAASKGINKEEEYKKLNRVEEISFDSTRKMMTTIHSLGNGRYRVITKGAPEVLIDRSINIYENGRVSKLEKRKRDIILKQNEGMAANALRVIAVGYKDIDYLPQTLESEYIEKDLIFTGLIGMIDPPRDGVKEAINTCKKAGIKIVMITGDHILTAKAIAKELGILKNNDLAITGKELENISQQELEKNIMRYSVFARVTPEHKVRIVKAFKATGAVTAMTGDGVNDAPALKNADIGIAMGKTGTDVAKNAADMILVDDNFVTIVEAVKYGRNIYDNIRKAIHFLISTNIGEIVTIFIGLLLGIKSPLLAIQLLWINLVTDSLPAIALGLEPPEKEIMSKWPRDSKKSIFSDGLWGKIIVEGIMIGMLTIMAYSIGNNLYGIEVGRTMAFASLAFLELIHSINIKSEKSIFKTNIFDNKYLIGSFVLGVLLQCVVIFVPSLAKIFKLVTLNKEQWIYTIIISIMPIVIVEIQKKFNNIKFGERIYGYKKECY